MLWVGFSSFEGTQFAAHFDTVGKRRTWREHFHSVGLINCWTKDLNQNDANVAATDASQYK